MDKNIKYALKTSLVFMSWVPVMYAFNEHVAFVSQIKGSSMSPTLNPAGIDQDYVLLWKWSTAKRNLHVNDVVLLRSPLEPTRIYAKRIKAMQGDQVRTRYPYPKEKILVPRNHIWCEGDNIHSVDSNNFGPVSSGLVVGKACWIIYPFSRFGKIPTGGRECRENHLRLQESDY